MPNQFRFPFSGRLKVRGVPDGVTPEVRSPLEAMQRAYAMFEGDEKLSPIGRKAALTNEAKAHIRALDEAQADVRARRRKLDEAAVKIYQSKKPVNATESEMRNAALVIERYERAVERGDQIEANRLRSVLTQPTEDVATLRLQVGLLALHPAVIGRLGEQLQTLARAHGGLDPEQIMGGAGQKLADEAEDLGAVEQQIVSARAQILRAVDRSQLERDGVVKPPVTTWSETERATFIEQHGRAAYVELLDEHMRETMGGMPTLSAAALGFSLQPAETLDALSSAPVPNGSPAAA